MEIKGTVSTRAIEIDGRLITPAKSLAVCNHSPDGFNWNYYGSGPVQLGLAILLEATDKETAKRNYHEFTRTFVAKFPEEDFDFEINVIEWLLMHDPLYVYNKEHEEDKYEANK